MVKNKFFKNLYQSLSFWGSVMVFVFALMFDFFYSIKYVGYVWVLPAISALLIFLYFSIGFYWIFQTVTIDEKGIKIMIFKRIIRECDWNQITEVHSGSIMKNPAYIVTLKNGKEIHLDERKGVKRAIDFYSRIDFFSSVDRVK